MVQILMFYRWIPLNKGLGSRSWPEIKLFREGFKLEKGGQLSELNDNTVFQDGQKMLQRILNSKKEEKGTLELTHIIGHSL